MNGIWKAVAVVGIVGVAGFSAAINVSIGGQASGLWTNPSSGVLDYDSTKFTNYLSSTLLFKAIDVTIDYGAVPGNVTGTFELIDAAGKQLDGTLTGSMTGSEGKNSTVSFSQAQLVFTGGNTPLYQSLHGTGSDSAGFTFYFPAANSSQKGSMKITASASSVPEPATLLLGGAAFMVGIVRRRTRKV